MVFPFSEMSAEENTGTKICIFSKHLQWLNYEEMARVAADLGFDGIDLTVRPGGHVLPENVERDLPKAVEAVRMAGLDVYMLTTAIQDSTEPYSESILKTAAILKIPFYRTNWFNFSSELSIQKNIEEFRKKFTRLNHLNKKYNIKGCYQNHSGESLGSATWDLWYTIKELDQQWIGAQYDIRHATLEGGHSWPVGFKLISPFIKTLAVKDFYWKQKGNKWEVENVPLGSGMVDFKKYFKMLKEFNINVPLSMHYEYPLGGAEHGHRELTINKEVVLKAMEKDVITLKKWMKEAGMIQN